MLDKEIAKDLSTFLDAIYPTGNTDGFRAKVFRLFDDRVEIHARSLLTSKPHAVNIEAINEMFKDTAAAATFLQLYMRALASKSQKAMLERKVDVKSILQEQIRMLKAKGKVRQYRRVI